MHVYRITTLQVRVDFKIYFINKKHSSFLKFK